MNKTITRMDYIDRIKALACALVVIGHFVMSMDASAIFPYTSPTKWFVNSIYMFHVQLFFVCSGFLYYYSVGHKNDYNYFKYTGKKLLNLGVPYFVFTTVTVLMKMIAGDAVNSKENGLLYTLFIEPTAPYWYLYVLFFMFLLIPPLRSKGSITVAMIIALALKVIDVSGLLSAVNLPYFAQRIMGYSIWFVLGMALSVWEYKPMKKHLPLGIIGLLLFTVGSVIVFALSNTNKAAYFILGLLAVCSIFILFSCTDIPSGKLTKIIIKYNLPIFLMHTIFAAGIRIILVKIGINQWYIHIPVGIVATFAGPVIAAFIMDKTKIFNILLYPEKTIKGLKAGAVSKK